MATGRFLSRTIATSRQLDALSWRAELLFYRCIPYLDRDGLIDGDPVVVKATTCPRSTKLPAACIGDLLQELHEKELIRWYEVDGVSVAFFPGFRTHNKGMKYDREAASRLPAPPKNPGPTPAELRLKVRTQSRTQDRSDSDLSLSEVQRKFKGTTEEPVANATGGTAKDDPWPLRDRGQS
jgi:hypothetical protein